MPPGDRDGIVERVHPTSLACAVADPEALLESGNELELLERVDVQFRVERGVVAELVRFELEDFERWQFDLPLLAGVHGDWYRVWGGPKAMFTTFGTRLVLP